MSRWKDQQKTEKVQEETKIPSLEEFEEGMENEIDELHAAFRERYAKEQKRVLDVIDSNYYFVVCFSNHDQLNEFCDSIGLDPNAIYYDGREFARRINRALTTPDTTFPKVQPFGKDYVDRARTPAEVKAGGKK